MVRFSPSNWAEQRRAQIQRAQQLRAERRPAAPRPPPAPPAAVCSPQKLRPPWATEEDLPPKEVEEPELPSTSRVVQPELSEAPPVPAAEAELKPMEKRRRSRTSQELDQLFAQAAEVGACNETELSRKKIEESSADQTLLWVEAGSSGNSTGRRAPSTALTSLFDAACANPSGDTGLLSPCSPAPEAPEVCQVVESTINPNEPRVEDSDFHVELVEPPGFEPRAWWANGPEPAWMRQLKYNEASTAAPSAKEAASSGSMLEELRDTPAEEQVEVSPCPVEEQCCVQDQMPSPAVKVEAPEETILMAAEARSAEERPAVEERPAAEERQEPEGFNLTRPCEREMPHVFRPKSRPEPQLQPSFEEPMVRSQTLSRSRPSMVDEPVVVPSWAAPLHAGEPASSPCTRSTEVSQWKLRDSPEDGFMAEDPMVFARPKQKLKRRAKPVEAAEPEDAHWAEAAFGKSRSQPLRSSSRPSTRTPKPRNVSMERPASGYFSRNVPNAAQQLPEALRRRLDERAERLKEHEGYPMKLPPLPSPSPAGPTGPTGPVGPPQPSRGRRAASQPPLELPPLQEPRRPKSQPEECSRQMFDKNTLRTMHRELFLGAIRNFRQQLAREAPEEQRGSAVKVYLRKRPLFDDRLDYDVLSIANSREVVIHNCLFQADLKTPFLQHSSFTFDHVFGEEATSLEVYETCARELVRKTRGGGISTMFMFGQTGSGKTHTMTAIQELSARDLFQGSDAEPWLTVQFWELRGQRCYDLLAGGRKDPRPELRLREHAQGFTAEAATLCPSSAEELCAVMQLAQQRRVTCATGANAVSSRSHAVCILRLLSSEGQLMLVDCAGTERKKDSMYHSKERQQEGAEINASLHALKECIRHFAAHQRVPGHAYRASSLTKVLAEAFLHQASLAVVCTASPGALDTEHSLATLRQGMALGGGVEREEKQIVDQQRRTRLVHPKQWTSEQVFDWLRNLNGFDDAAQALPSNTTGQMLVRLTENRCVQLCAGNERRGRRLFDLLHQEILRADASRKG